ncbi:MAG: 6-carboxytetrahydropterin synthase [Planctomycetota bacterium]|nr:6-carboxytetrahydropterin synthase [Planctomycetota bacterium]
MPYRICKVFEIETAHMLTQHPEKCRFPHGHSRRVEVVLSAGELDAAGMVCDLKAIKLALAEFMDSFDHTICMNSSDPLLPELKKQPGARLIIYDNLDPTTEVLAKHMFDYIQATLKLDVVYPTAEGAPAYRIGQQVTLERVRVWETSSTWAEYSEDSAQQQ